jgi:hypothetical protein
VRLSAALLAEFEAIDRDTEVLWQNLRSSIQQLTGIASQVAVLQSSEALLLLEHVLLRSVSIGQQLLLKYMTQ